VVSVDSGVVSEESTEDSAEPEVVTDGSVDDSSFASSVVSRRQPVPRVVPKGCECCPPVHSLIDLPGIRHTQKDRSDTELTNAYDAVREIRDEESLFDRHSLTIEEAVFTEDTPSKEETSGYEKGDSFECSFHFL
jgi:hypothetical protein